MSKRYVCPDCKATVRTRVDGLHIKCAQCGLLLETWTGEPPKQVTHYRCDVCLEVLGSSHKVGWTTCGKCHKGTLRPITAPEF